MIIDKNNLHLLKSKGLEIIGQGRHIPEDFSFQGPCGVKFAEVAQQCSLGAYSYIVSGHICGVDIGRYCSFGENVQIGRQSHPINWLSTSPFTYMQTEKVVNVIKLGGEYNANKMNHTTAPTKLKKTKIGNDVWIGHGALIMPGVEISSGAIIAAGSVVTKDVEPYSVVGGNPARHLKYRVDISLITPLLKSNWWKYPPEILCQLDCSKPRQLIEILHKNKDTLVEKKIDYLTLKEIING